MDKLIKLVIQYQKKESDLIFNEIIKTTKNIILHYVYKVHRYYQEDLKQELLMGLYTLIKKYKQDITITTSENKLLESQKKFIKCLLKKLNYIYIDFYRKNKLKEINTKIDINLDNNFFCTKDDNRLTLDKYITNPEDLKFLKNFISKDGLLTEKEVGLKLGITQQAVNKRKQKIIKKYKKH